MYGLLPRFRAATARVRLVHFTAHLLVDCHSLWYHTPEPTDHMCLRSCVRVSQHLGRRCCCCCCCRVHHFADLVSEMKTDLQAAIDRDQGQLPVGWGQGRPHLAGVHVSPKHGRSSVLDRHCHGARPDAHPWSS